MLAGRYVLYNGITKSPQRKEDGKNNRKIIKHKQNKKMPDIYSLPLKHDLHSTFSIKQNQRTFLDGYHRRSWCQPVLGGGGHIHSKKREMQS